MKRTTAYALCVGLFACSLLAADPVTRRHAARLQATRDKIVQGPAAAGKAPATPAITETEVNSYLQFGFKDRIPDGVTDPWVSILESGRLAGKATVDLARVGKS